LGKLALPGALSLGSGLLSSDNDVLLQKALLRVIMRALSDDAAIGSVMGE
jgi:hypothetical protein